MKNRPTYKKLEEILKVVRLRPDEFSTKHALHVLMLRTISEMSPSSKARKKLSDEHMIRYYELYPYHFMDDDSRRQLTEEENKVIPFRDIKIEIEIIGDRSDLPMHTIKRTVDGVVDEDLRGMYDLYMSNRWQMFKELPQTCYEQDFKFGYKDDPV